MGRAALGAGIDAQRVPENAQAENCGGESIAAVERVPAEQLADEFVIVL